MPKLTRGKSYSRAGIERIRATINARLAIQDLWEIGHEKSNPPGVRVKALSVLLNKVMPDLTESDVSVTHHVAPQTAAEQMQRLLRLLGREAVEQRWPDLLARYEAGNLDQIPAPASEPVPGKAVRLEGPSEAEDISQTHGLASQEGSGSTIYPESDAV